MLDTSGVLAQVSVQVSSGQWPERVDDSTSLA
jgi:hypothetical protein